MPSARTPEGLEWKESDGEWRLTATCQHQSGRLYIIEGAENWVCSNPARPSHSLAGFLGELVAMGDPRIEPLMRRWGLYYRALPLEADAAEK